MLNKSFPKSFGKSASLFPRRRMHSPTACASCTMRNVTKLLQNVTEPLRKISILPINNISFCSSLKCRHACSTYTLHYPIPPKQKKFASSLTENINPKVPIGTMEKFCLRPDRNFKFHLRLEAVIVYCIAIFVQSTDVFIVGTLSPRLRNSYNLRRRCQ